MYLQTGHGDVSLFIVDLAEITHGLVRVRVSEQRRKELVHKRIVRGEKSIMCHPLTHAGPEFLDGI